MILSQGLGRYVYLIIIYLNAACSPCVAGSAERWAALVTAALLTILMLPSVMWRNRLLSRVQSCLRMRTSSHTLLPHARLVSPEEDRYEDGGHQDEDQREVDAVEQLGRSHAPRARRAGARLGRGVGGSLSLTSHNNNVLFQILDNAQWHLMWAG